MTPIGQPDYSYVKEPSELRVPSMGLDRSGVYRSTESAVRVKKNVMGLPSTLSSDKACILIKFDQCSVVFDEIVMAVGRSEVACLNVVMRRGSLQLRSASRWWSVWTGDGEVTQAAKGSG